MENKLALLNELYNQRGWQHLENFILQEIKTSQEIIKKDSSPERDVNFARAKWSVLEALLDKVESDKINYREQTKT
jgi:hypothetical protein